MFFFYSICLHHVNICCIQKPKTIITEILVLFELDMKTFEIQFITITKIKTARLSNQHVTKLYLINIPFNKEGTIIDLPQDIITNKIIKFL